MTFAKLSILAFCCFLTLEICLSHVIYTTTEISKEKVEETENVHITKLVHPSEIRVPTIEELAPFVHNADATSERSPETPAPEVKTLSYNELYKLLAMWQLENEKNFYEMTEMPLMADDNEPSSAGSVQLLLKHN